MSESKVTSHSVFDEIPANLQLPLSREALAKAIQEGVGYLEHVPQMPPPLYGGDGYVAKRDAAIAAGVRALIECAGILRTEEYFVRNPAYQAEQLRRTALATAEAALARLRRTVRWLDNWLFTYQIALRDTLDLPPGYFDRKPVTRTYVPFEFDARLVLAVQKRRPRSAHFVAS